jgi:hypothetical protein
LSGRVPLPRRLRIGRAADSGLFISHSSVSRDHALLGWTGLAWELRDLGSQNGTTVDGQQLPGGGRAELGLGSLVQLGGVAAFELVDTLGPAPFARSADGRVIEGSLDLLCLGAEEASQGEEPEAERSVWFSASGDWILEERGRVRPIGDGERLHHQGALWTLSLPPPQALDATDRAPGTLRPRLRLRLETGTLDVEGRIFQREQGGETQACPLTPTEARLLLYLSEHPGRTISHRELLSAVLPRVHGEPNRLCHRESAPTEGRAGPCCPSPLARGGRTGLSICPAPPVQLKLCLPVAHSFQKRQRQ